MRKDASGESSGEFYKSKEFIDSEFQKEVMWSMNMRQMIWGNVDINLDKIYLMRIFHKDYVC